ncbi:hypothetical protein BdWA1_003290 [Babesia duncani]|uniref:Uncharacterized protein n=1 Tax=Babesia duncani TaxID=323732 RepID=A0AAD9UNC2_9APIC|nr:hypothetical protein BdWA1_003290 [Babesia duncani]
MMIPSPKKRFAQLLPFLILWLSRRVMSAKIDSNLFVVYTLIRLDINDKSLVKTPFYKVKEFRTGVFKQFRFSTHYRFAPVVDDDLVIWGEPNAYSENVEILMVGENIFVRVDVVLSPYQRKSEYRLKQGNKYVNIPGETFLSTKIKIHLPTFYDLMQMDSLPKFTSADKTIFNSVITSITQHPLNELQYNDIKVWSINEDMNTYIVQITAYFSENEPKIIYYAVTFRTMHGSIYVRFYKVIDNVISEITELPNNHYHRLRNRFNGYKTIVPQDNPKMPMTLDTADIDFSMNRISNSNPSEDEAPAVMDRRVAIYPIAKGTLFIKHNSHDIIEFQEHALPIIYLTDTPSGLYLHFSTFKSQIIDTSSYILLRKDDHIPTTFNALKIARMPLLKHIKEYEIGVPIIGITKFYEETSNTRCTFFELDYDFVVDTVTYQSRNFWYRPSDNSTLFKRFSICISDQTEKGILVLEDINGKEHFKKQRMTREQLETILGLSADEPQEMNGPPDSTESNKSEDKVYEPPQPESTVPKTLFSTPSSTESGSKGHPMKPEEQKKAAETLKPEERKKAAETLKPEEQKKAAETLKPEEQKKAAETLKPEEQKKAAETLKPEEQKKAAETLKPEEQKKTAEASTSAAKKGEVDVIIKKKGSHSPLSLAGTLFTLILFLDNII